LRQHRLKHAVAQADSAERAHLHVLRLSEGSFETFTRREPMATIMLMHWREATPDQYNRAREMVGWDRDVRTGAKLHVSGFGDARFRLWR
jgi:hypothetical protein